MNEQDKKMVKMLQQLQADIESSVKGALARDGIKIDRDVELLRWEDGVRGIVKAGPCASQAGCTKRCKPNVILCGVDFVCEADHICGYRCRLVQDQCGRRTCYSQPH